MASWSLGWLATFFPAFIAYVIIDNTYPIGRAVQQPLGIRMAGFLTLYVVVGVLIAYLEIRRARAAEAAEEEAAA